MIIPTACFWANRARRVTRTDEPLTRQGRVLLGAPSSMAIRIHSLNSSLYLRTPPPERGLMDDGCMMRLMPVIHSHPPSLPLLDNINPNKPTPLYEQACISRSARGAVWGVLTCLFAQGGIKGPKIFFACGAPRIPLEIFKETVFSLQCFSFGPGAVLGGAYMLVRQHACSHKGVQSIYRQEDSSCVRGWVSGV